MANPKLVQSCWASTAGPGLVLLVLLAAGTFLRLHMLGTKSLWLDEAFSVTIARMSWPAFLHTVWWGEANMTAYYVLLRAWTKLGDSEFWLRSLSVIFGVLTIPAIYGLGERFFSKKAGLIAAALLTLHAYHIRYSQELRSYTLVALLVVLSTYAFLAALEKPSRTDYWALYVLFTSLAIYAQVFAAFVVCSQWILLTPERIKRLGVFKLLSVGAATGILVAPIAAVMLLQNKGQIDWVPRPNAIRILDVFYDMAGAEAFSSPHPVRSALLLVFYVATWILALGFVHPRTTRPGTEPALAVLTSWFVFPIAAMIVLSFFKPIMYPRFLFMCVPAAALLAAYGLINLEQCLPRGRIVSLAVLLIILGLAAFSARDYYIGFKGYGHDWRAVTTYISSRDQPQDAALFYTPSGHRVFDYYVRRERDSGVCGTSPAVLFPINLDGPRIVERTAPYRRVWLVLHQTIPTPETHRQAELIVGALQTHFRLVSEREFPGAGTTRGETGTIRVALYEAAVPEKP